MTGITLDGSVIVVTGASSGIGRATALELAKRGASVVAAARSRPDLDALEVAAGSHPGELLTVQTDVSDLEAVMRLADRARERFGHIDGWINDAAVMAYGEFWDIPVDSYRQVLETNLFGTVHGARAALDHFRARGRGVLVNVSSVYGRVTTPYVSPYVVSKFAIRGLTECLRQEVTRLPDVDVCAIYPQAVDTPIFRQAANYTGRELTALPLTVEPDRVVRAILRCLQRPRAEVIVGAFGHVLAWGRATFPRTYERVAPHVMQRLAFRSGSTPPSDGNLFAPQPRDNETSGHWRSQRHTARRATAAAAVVTAVAAGAAAVEGARRLAA